LALLLLALFAGIWIWVGVKILTFHPTPTQDKVTFTDAQVMVAGFLASAVGAGTASILGIEVQKSLSNRGLRPRRPRLARWIIRGSVPKGRLTAADTLNERPPTVVPTRGGESSPDCAR
jgi:hypothetical protein